MKGWFSYSLGLASSVSRRQVERALLWEPLKVAACTLPAFSGICSHGPLITHPHSEHVCRCACRRLQVSPSPLCLKLVTSCSSYKRAVEHLRRKPSLPEVPRAPEKCPHTEPSACTARYLAACHLSLPWHQWLCSVVPRPAAAASPGNLLKMQILGAPTWN